MRARGLSGLSVRVVALMGAGRGGRWRSVPAVLCACVCAVCACLAVGAGPASAAGLEFEFGGRGEGAGQLEGPSGVAVDQLTGDIFVADKENNRIDEFSASGKFERAWGWEVNRKSPRAELQECTTVSECQAGKGVGGAGALNLPEGIAIDSTLGSEALYVLDHKNNRVEKFSLVSGHEGEFLAMWGGGVNSAGGNVCTKAEAVKCQAGAEGTGHTEFKDLGVQGAIAIGAGGAVYVGDYRRVQWFSGEGVYEGSFEVEAEQRVEALAVSTAGAGQVYLTVSQTKEGFAEDDIPAEVWCYSVAGGLEHKIVLEQQPLNSSGGVSIWLAVDGSGKLFVDEFVTETTNEKVTQYITEYGSGFEELGRYAPPGGDSEKADSGVPGGERENRYPGGLALSESAKVATGFLLGFHERVEDVVRGEPAPPLGPSVEGEEGVAEPGAAATLKASVDPQGKETTYHFDYGTEVSNETESPTVTMVAEGFKSETVELKLTGLTPKDIYHFHVVAENSNGGPIVGEDVHFEALPAVAVDSVSAGDVTAESAQLEAQIDPTGTDTEYHFEYTAAGEAEHVTESVNVGAGSSDVPVSAHIQGLKANTTYAYRVVAKNVLGEASLQARLTTQRAGAPFALLDGRSWEQVSPPNKGVAFITLGGSIASLQSSPDGGALTYSGAGFSEGEPEGEPLFGVQFVSRHGSDGWSTKDIASRNEHQSNVKDGESGEYWLFSEDLERSIVEPSPYTKLSEWTTERTPYLRDEAKCVAPAASGSECFVPLVTSKGPFADVAESVKFGGPQNVQRGDVQFVGGTPDLSHLVLKAHGSEGEEKGPELIEGAGEGGLYEWSAGRLTLLSVAPGGAPCSRGSMLGYEAGSNGLGKNARNAISPEGSLVVWSSAQGTGGACAGHLYLRDVAQPESVQLDEVQQGGSGAGKPAAEYQDASVGDEHVFFSDSQRLTADATGVPGGSQEIKEDLYEYDRVSKTLVDLTTPVNAGEAAGVQGVLGASEDGSYVYFVADGVLSRNENAEKETAKPGDCAHAADAVGQESLGCSLYVAHYNGGGWEAPVFIARLSGADENDWSPPQDNGVGLQTARVSPNGKWLAFMSDRSLTGYDNVDVDEHPTAKEEEKGVTAATKVKHADEEVFLYDAGSNNTVCASCNPSGARPTGMVINNDNPNAPDYSPLVNRQETWRDGRWLSGVVPSSYATDQFGELALHQPRYLSNGGRLFFDSTEGLVPTDKNGVVDAYEYEPPVNGEVAGSDSCTDGSQTYSPAADGCVDLVSSGTSTEESVFIEASENGDDVFFLTAEKLAKSDTDTAYDVYDAHVCGSGWVCPVPAAVSPPCSNTESCRAAPAPAPSIFGAPSSATFVGAGNVTPAASTPPKKKVTKKAVKCKRGFVKNKKGRCVKSVRKKKKARKATRATNDRRAN